MKRLLLGLAAIAILVTAFVPTNETEATRTKSGWIITIAGTGTAGRSGDGGLPTRAQINHPRAIAFLKDGSFVFTEPFQHTIRRVSANWQTIQTVAGTGTGGYNGDGGPARDAQVNFVHGIAPMPDGGYVFADMWNERIRRVWRDGHISTVAGMGNAGFAGDGGPATAARISLPRGVATLPGGVIFIADSSNSRIRRVGLNGKITTVAGNGEPGSGGDHGPATAAQLARPFFIAPLPRGGYVIADSQANLIRKVDAKGTITTLAGTGEAGFSGDGGPARNATINNPHSVIVLPDGGFLIADTGNNRIRRVWPNGTIRTVAGTGDTGFGGDNGPALRAELNEPKALALVPAKVAGARGFVVGDASNNRVRLVQIDLRARPRR